MVAERRTWARVAGLMYLLVLVVDLTGLQAGRPLGGLLMLTGSLLTIPLALGLYFTLERLRPVVSGVALACRLGEALVGVIATLSGFETIFAALRDSELGRATLAFVGWNRATSFGALLFGIGSTLFFFVFLRSADLPRALSWLGLIASLIAFAACATHLIRPQFPAMSAIAWTPMLVAEIATGGWLLFRSAGISPRVEARVRSS